MGTVQADGSKNEEHLGRTEPYGPVPGCPEGRVRPGSEEPHHGPDLCRWPLGRMTAVKQAPASLCRSQGGGGGRLWAWRGGTKG